MKVCFTINCKTVNLVFSFLKGNSWVEHDILSVMTLSWHHSHICYQTSSPCASAGPAQRYPCLCQGFEPITGIPAETGKNMRVHACLIILLKEGIHIEPAECVCHSCSWISRLEDQHIQSCRSQPLLLPTPSTAPALMLMACGLTCSGVPIGVRCSPVWWGRR